MPIVYATPEDNFTDDERRSSIYAGDFFVYSPRPTTLALCDHAREILEQMLGFEPWWAQQRMSEAEFLTLFRVALRNFSRRGAAMKLVSSLLLDLGCDGNRTYLTSPELTAITGQGFLANGIGEPRHPHRDTWFAASTSQLHWWIPIFDDDATSSIAFHPQYWDWPIANSSVDFDYEQWQRAQLAGEAMPDAARRQPRALETVALDPEIRMATPAGGLIMFSSAQLYSILPNDSLKTHFAIHFQTVNKTDLVKGVGAVNIDAAARGNSLSGFVKCDDLSPIWPELIEDARREGDQSRSRTD